MSRLSIRLPRRTKGVGYVETIILAKNFDELMDKLKEWNREEKPVAIFRFEITRTDVGDWQADVLHL